GFTTNSQNRKADKLMKKYYDKPYEMAFRADIESNPKYANKSVYRYLLKQEDEDELTVTATQGPGYGGNTFHNRDMFFVDRQTGKAYPKTGHAGVAFEMDMRIIAPYLGKMK
ncbi:MAG: hypothetical protein ACHQEB_05735, partial [Chitinophagales bacterium]